MHQKSLISCVLLLSAFAGCQFFGKSDNTKLTGGGMDMFTPAKMRLHPLSRFTPTPPVLEARVELTDQFGDIGKGVGTIVFNLFAYDALSFDHKGKRLGQWPASLTTPQENRDHWDAITRTYLFKLPLEGNAPDSRTSLLLIATLTIPNGEQLTDDITLPPK